MKSTRIRGRSRPATAGVLGLLVVLLGAPAAAQPTWRPGFAPDPIGQSRALSERPLQTAPAPPPPAERLVPERRVFVPGMAHEVVVPPHYERRITDQQYQAPPLIGLGARGEIVHIPGGERPPADVRQSP